MKTVIYYDDTLFLNQSLQYRWNVQGVCFTWPFCIQSVADNLIPFAYSRAWLVNSLVKHALTVVWGFHCTSYFFGKYFPFCLLKWDNKNTITSRNAIQWFDETFARAMCFNDLSRKFETLFSTLRILQKQEVETHSMQITDTKNCWLIALDCVSFCSLLLFSIFFRCFQ